ncbi:hypothetical protein ACFIOY_09450 [Bradyrhizobium sp. TZ2]
MSKPSLQLVHCSNSIQPGARHRRNGRSFRPRVVDGGVRSVPGAQAWQAALELFGLGLLAFYGSYLAALEVHMTILNGSNWPDPEKTG